MRKRWWRFHSAEMGEDFCVVEELPDTAYSVRFEDGVKYSVAETAMLIAKKSRDSCFFVPKSVHEVKKAFNGALISAERVQVNLPSYIGGHNDTEEDRRK